MDNRRKSLLMLIVVIIVVTAVSGQNTNASNYCTTTPRKITWTECEKTMNDFVGGNIDTVFEGSNPWWWPSLTEPEVKGNCSVYKGVHDTKYMVRTDISPEPEQLLAEGFHEMMSYILCDEDGAAGYLYARVCLESNVVRDKIVECFLPYYNYTQYVPYKSLGESDDLAHEHCDVFKKYQQCRIDVFTAESECNEEVADWNNEAIIRYYDEYMEEVHCDIDPGLSTHEIIFIVVGCMGGILVCFCLCFCCSRFVACNKEQEDQDLFKKMTSKKKKLKEAKALAEKNGVVNKGYQKDDVESGKAKQNGAVKKRGENGYYNTKELDNNSDNERTEKVMSEKPLDTIDERDEDRDRHYRERRDRDRDYRDSPRNPRRDSPRDSPMGSPRGHRRDSPRRDRRDYPREYGREEYDPGRFNRNRRRSGPSYDDMVYARVHGDNGRPPRNFNDIRSMMKPRGLHRY